MELMNAVVAGAWGQLACTKSTRVFVLLGSHMYTSVPWLAWTASSPVSYVAFLLQYVSCIMY